jgi:hypothetical protein
VIELSEKLIQELESLVRGDFIEISMGIDPAEIHLAQMQDREIPDLEFETYYCVYEDKSYQMLHRNGKSNISNGRLDVLCEGLASLKGQQFKILTPRRTGLASDDSVWPSVTMMDGERRLVGGMRTLQIDGIDGNFNLIDGLNGIYDEPEVRE